MYVFVEKSGYLLITMGEMPIFQGRFDQYSFFIGE